MPKIKKLKIVEAKLGRERAWGQTDSNTIIEIDPRMRSKKYLKVLIHELLHVCFKSLSEREVIRASGIVCEGVWQQNYRRIKE